MRHEGFTVDSSAGVTCTLFASTAPDVHTAAVLVHGWRGDQEGTWRHFPALIDATDAFDGWDFYYLGYESVRETIGASAASLTAFIESIYPAPPRAIFHTPPNDLDIIAEVRDRPTTYNSLALIGHSQGGVVIRKAIVEVATDAAEGNNPDHPLCQARVFLFAPALFGMVLSGWLGFGSETSLWKVLRPMLSRSPSFKELQPGSSMLAALQRETERLQQGQRAGIPALSARIAWAPRDGVVAGGQRYQRDPPYVYIGNDHGDICKPRPDYIAPLTFVVA